MMAKVRLFLQNHPKIYKTIFYLNTILIGCFSFPLLSPRSLIDFWKIYSLIVAYGIVGLGFLGIYGEGKDKFVYILSIILVGIGMICRYFWEYGEVSNIRDFTLFNIISFLVIIPIYTTFIYKYILKYLIKQG